ncbi:MAG: magnesium transporter CorA family protein [Bauldia sp.]
MLNAYAMSPSGPRKVENPHLPDDQRIGWIDLLTPTSEEDKAAEAFLGVSIPTQEEASEIEFSSRFYNEDSGQYLTISIVAGYDAGEPFLTPLTFVFSRHRLATVRYAEFAALRQFLARLPKIGDACRDPAGVFVTLVEAVIDRVADIVEKTGVEIDRLNKEIFARGARPKAAGGKRRERQLEGFLKDVGYQNDIVSKTRESLASIERMLQFISAFGLLPPRLGETPINAAPPPEPPLPPPQPANGKKKDKPEKPKIDPGTLKLMARDVRSLTDHLSFLSTRATFLLEATLGLISVQQNEVIRIFTAVATVLLPPTLIGTLYGMNFTYMPELDWTFGYPLAILVMVASAVVPFLILKKRGWF